MRFKRIGTAAVCLLLACALTACGPIFGSGGGSNTGGSHAGGDKPPSEQPTPDTENPSVLLGDMATALEVGQSLTVRFTVCDNVSTADAIYTEVIVLNGAGINVTALNYRAADKTFTPTAAGTYSLVIEAYDEAGNSASATHTVTVTERHSGGTTPMPTPDTQKPTVTPGDMATTLEIGQSLTVRFTVHDDVSAADKIKTEVKIINATGQDVTAVAYRDGTFTPTAAGEYRITVSACDEAGNSASATHTVSVLTAQYRLPTDPRLPADRTDVSVHDPSVFFDPVGKKYYAYGSHFAVASSTDLLHWNFVSDTPQSVFGNQNWRSVLTKADAFAGGTQNTWAPDVEYYNGKYYMYFSLTSGFGSNKSFIGRVESDSPTGPFARNETEIVTSDGSRGAPNAIDPELFYDKDGGLWLVYGSFFAGIYVKELYNSGSNWGLPKQSGYGKKVWQGSGNGPEGPYIFYNDQTDYYYLMTSYGELSHNYNMCVARSKNPDGPFTDAAGNDVASVAGAGNKLAGNYRFDGAASYTALGHNSIVKTEDGKYLNVFHTRYALGTPSNPGAHNLRVHQMFFNADGWPIMSPARYAGETCGRVPNAHVAGAYDVIVHTADKAADTIVDSIAYTLTADGKITRGGAAAGSWAMTGDNTIDVTVNGVLYRGVVVPTWCIYRNKAVLSITAVSSGGVSLWANGT